MIKHDFGCKCDHAQVPKGRDNTPIVISVAACHPTRNWSDRRQKRQKRTVVF